MVRLINTSVCFAGSSLILFLIFLQAGCQKRTPVEEVSLAGSSVVFKETRDEGLDSQWPGWRGPHQTGCVEFCEVPKNWGESENIRWRVDIPGRGHASPVIVNERIYLASAEEDSQKQIILALALSDGKILWKKTVNEGGFPRSGKMHRKSSHANGTVFCDGERVYDAFLHHEGITAVALDAGTGEIVWDQKLGAFNSKFGYAPSPIPYHSFIIFSADNQGGGYLTAVDRKTGKIAWRIGRPAKSSYSSARIAHVGGRDQLLISGCDSVSSYNPRTGEEYWQTAATSEATCGTIVTTKDQIFASGGYPGSQTLALDGQGTVLWTNQTKTYEPSMVVVNEKLLTVTDKGIAYCWNIKDGSEQWKHRLEGGFSSSPLACENRIYISNANGQTFVFLADSDQYEQVAVNHLGSDCYASPAVYKGELFLRIGVGQGNERKEQLVCISKKTK